MVKHEYSPSLQALVEDVSKRMFPHIKTERVRCYRLYDFEKKNVLARCHGLSETMQIALGVEPFYVLEFLGKKFNELSTEEKVKVVIHELLYISLNFDGTFRENGSLTSKELDGAYKDYLNCRKNDSSIDWIRI